jgi:predicted ABC-type ATPase
MQKKYIYIIAGPNGAGKTTFAKSFIPDTVNITQYVNADMIAYGLSPFVPEREAVQAGKLMLRQIDNLSSAEIIAW